MGKFASATKQATAVIKVLQGGPFKGVGTIRNFESSLKLVAQFVIDNKLGSLQDLTIENAIQFLEERAFVVGDKTLDQNRHAIQAMLHHVSKKLEPSNSLPILKSINNSNHPLNSVSHYMKENELGNLSDLTIEQASQYLQLRALDESNKTLIKDKEAIEKLFHFKSSRLELGEKLPTIKSEDDNKHLLSRAYSKEQVEIIANHQTLANSIATIIADYAGLRAHEILTISYPEEQPITPRFHNEPALHKFEGRKGRIYTVQGKGGLIRNIVISHHLSEKLEKLRLEIPRTVIDRNINYTQRYDISGGQKWSNSFSAASNRTLKWSRGAHGLRHSYAQIRVLELQEKGLSPHEAKRTVSQEMGHFRASIIEIYLR